MVGSLVLAAALVASAPSAPYAASAQSVASVTSAPSAASAPYALSVASTPSARHASSAPSAARVPGGIYVGREQQLHVSLPRVGAAEPVIDGSLDEPVWQQAALLTGFSQFSPSDGVPAADSTQVLLWYSATALYVGIRAYEAHGAVHATLADRDRIDADDNVQILLGTFHDQRQAYVFAVNPLGVQEDGTIVESGTDRAGGWTPTLSGRAAADLTQDFVFTSRGHLTPWGYEVEIRIPFKSLKFQSSDPQSWDLNVVRDVQHSGYEDSWAPARRSAASFLAQSGTLDGLSGLDRGIVMDVNPVVTQKLNGAPGRSGWAYDRATPQLGGNLRWGIGNNITLNGTVRPDFAEVESDAGQLVIDPRQALYFPEKRPFFLDGLEQFRTPHNLIYTRRVVQPDAALKLTSKVASTDVAVLSALDDPSASPSGHDRPLFDILRVQRDLGHNSRLGVAYTDREVGGDYNRVADIDGRILFGGLYSAWFQAAGSFDRSGGVARNGPLWEGILAREGKRFAFRYILTGISGDFLARSGFISRAGIVHGFLDHTLNWFGARGSLLEALTGSVDLDGTWLYPDFTRGKQAQDRKLHFSGTAGLRGGWSIGGGIYFESFGFDQGLYAGYRSLTPTGDTLPFTGTPHIPNRDYVFTLTTPQWSKLDASLLYVGGQDENFYEWAQADIDVVSLTVHLRASDRARLEGTLQYDDYWRRSDGSLVARHLIPRLKLEYQLARSIFVRVVGEYEADRTDDLRDVTRTEYMLLVDGQPALATRSRSLRGDYLFSYRPTPGTVFFLGYGNEADGTPAAEQRFSWQPLRRASDYFFVKCSYLLRR